MACLILKLGSRYCKDEIRKPLSTGLFGLFVCGLQTLERVHSDGLRKTLGNFDLLKHDGESGGRMAE